MYKMRLQQIIFIMVVIATGFFPNFSILWAKEKNKDLRVIFEPNEKYDIYYQVSDYEYNSLRAILIEGTATLGDTDFLVVVSSNTLDKDKKAYIAIESVKAIFPTFYFNPQRVSTITHPPNHH